MGACSGAVPLRLAWNSAGKAIFYKGHARIPSLAPGGRHFYLGLTYHFDLPCIFPDIGIPISLFCDAIDPENTLLTTSRLAAESV